MSVLIVKRSTPPAGQLVDGEAATISGSGFGATGPTILAVDTFEGGSNGATVLTSSPQVGSYTSVNGVTYSNSSPHSGTLCARSAPQGGDQFRNIVIDVGVSSGGKLYFSAWLKCVGGVGGQKKIYELHGNPHTGNFAPGFGTADGYTYCAREDVEYLDDQAVAGQNYYGSEVDDSGGTWQHWEILAELNSAGGVADGNILVRIDNTPTFNMVNKNNRRDTSRAWGPLAWVDGHTNPTGAYVVYFTDELLCQRSWARVILRQGSLRVPQKVTSWGGELIGYDVFKGALASGDVEEDVYDDAGSLIQSFTRGLA